MKCAQRVRTENDIDVVKQVDAKSAIVYPASEQNAARSHADRSTASFNDFLKVGRWILILEEQAIIQRPEQRPGNHNYEEHRWDSQCDSRSQSDKGAGGNNKHRRGEESTS